MEVGVTVLGDIRKSETWPPVCLEAHVGQRPSTVSRPSRTSDRPDWRPSPLPGHGGLLRKLGAFLLLKDSDKCVKVEQKLVLADTYDGRRDGTGYRISDSVPMS